MRWIWLWLMDPEDDDPQKVYVLDLAKTMDKMPKAHAWDRTQDMSF